MSSGQHHKSHILSVTSHLYMYMKQWCAEDDDADHPRGWLAGIVQGIEPYPCERGPWLLLLLWRLRAQQIRVDACRPVTRGCRWVFWCSKLWLLIQPHSQGKSQGMGLNYYPRQHEKYTFSQSFKQKCVVKWEVVVWSSFIWVLWKAKFLTYCVMWYYWWGCREIWNW